MSNKPVKQVTTDTGAVDDAVVKRSNPTGSGNSNLASSLELAAALESSQQAIKDKDAEIAALRAQLSATDKATASDDAIAKLAATIAALVPKPQASSQGPTEQDTLNKATDFNNQKVTIDGRSLMEAQVAVNEFRNEKKVPIAISKSLQSQFGPNLSVSVNGVRVSVPCDGRTYYINKTHAIHIKERIAKVDNLNAKPGEDITIKA